MEEMYGFHSTTSTADYVMSPENLMIPAEYHSLFSSSSGDHHRRQFPLYVLEDLISAASAMSEAASITVEIRRSRCEQVDYEEDDDENAYSVIKAKIASHPLYLKLLDAYIDCQKELKLKKQLNVAEREIKMVFEQSHAWDLKQQPDSLEAP